MVRLFTTSSGAQLPYVQAGSPTGKPFLAIPGLSDGLRPMSGTATEWMLRRYYRSFADHRTIVSSRRLVHPDGFTIEDMAADIAELIRSLDAGPVDVLGVSMGGMIAQALAIKEPDLVDHLILGVTVPYIDDDLRRVLQHWQHLAESGRWRDHQADALRWTLTGHLPLKYRLMRPLVKLMPVRGDPERYRVQSEAILQFDVRDRLSDIATRTLVISGADDVLTKAAAGRQMAAAIPGAQFISLKRAGHNAFDQQKREFDCAVHGFLHDRLDLGS